MVRSPETVNLPALDRDIVSVAASEAAVLKLNLVALLSAAKSPSDTASIPAATNLESVPVSSSGAWKLIVPRTSPASIFISPVSIVSKTGLLSVVALDLSSIPSSGSWVIVTSLPAPRFSTAPSERRARSSPITASFTTLNPPSV